MATQKISPYSLPDLKSTTDDALANYLRGLNFAQNNSKLDFRLYVGFTSVFIAGLTFVADYRLGWEATKGWTAVAVGVYMILSAIYSYWMWAVEGGLVFEGTRAGKRIILASRTVKHDPTYYLTVTTTSSSSSSTGQASTWQIQAPFTTWFTADGYFVAQPFQKWLASSVKVIGDADTKNASRDELPKGANGAVSATAVAASGVGSEQKTPGGSKRTKRKG